MRKRIYLDYASTTPLDPEVSRAMLPYFGKKFGNPSSIHAEGLEAKKAVDASRKNVALVLQACAEEIVFTSGGTESNNLAIFGAVRVLEKKGVPISKMHFITTEIEHSSILECFRELEARGAKVDYAQVEHNGIVDPKAIGKLLRPETVLVSVGYANNEIGTIQPVREISKTLRNFAAAKPVFHSDASQAPLYLDLNVERLGVDLLTLDAHKMCGPKGVGALYVKRGTPILPIIFGGGQERGLRSTTENVPGIVGFSVALEIAAASRKKESARLTALRDYCIREILRQLPKAVLNGGLRRLPNNVNISIQDLDAEFTLLQLDAAGLSCSTKSSCLGSEGGSYVVRALGGGEARANSTLRFTFGRETTKKDIKMLLARLKSLVV